MATTIGLIHLIAYDDAGAGLAVTSYLFHWYVSFHPLLGCLELALAQKRLDSGDVLLALTDPLGVCQLAGRQLETEVEQLRLELALCLGNELVCGAKFSSVH